MKALLEALQELIESWEKRVSPWGATVEDSVFNNTTSYSIETLKAVVDEFKGPTYIFVLDAERLAVNFVFGSYEAAADYASERFDIPQTLWDMREPDTFWIATGGGSDLAQRVGPLRITRKVVLDGRSKLRRIQFS